MKVDIRKKQDYTWHRGDPWCQERRSGKFKPCNEANVFQRNGVKIRRLSGVTPYGYCYKTEAITRQLAEEQESATRKRVWKRDSLKIIKHTLQLGQHERLRYGLWLQQLGWELLLQFRKALSSRFHKGIREIPGILGLLRKKLGEKLDRVEENGETCHRLLWELHRRKYVLRLDETKRRPEFGGRANEGGRRCGRNPWPWFGANWRGIKGIWQCDRGTNGIGSDVTVQYILFGGERLSNNAGHGSLPASPNPSSSLVLPNGPHVRPLDSKTGPLHGADPHFQVLLLKLHLPC